MVDSGGIQGNSVRYEFITGDQSAALDLDAHALDGFIQPAVYFLSLQFRRDLPQRVITFDYGSATDQTWLDNQRWEIVARSDGTTPVETLPTPGDELLNKITVFAASATASNYFYIGSPKADTPGQGGWVDNIRLGRLDTVPHAALAIPATGANGSLPLVAGAYRFSVFVKSEVDDQVTPAPAGANRFRAGQIVLGMNDDLELVARSEGGWSTDEWALVSAVFHLEASELDSATLRLTVIHPDRPVIGSVLIAAPTLELVSGDGSE